MVDLIPRAPYWKGRVHAGVRRHRLPAATIQQLLRLGITQEGHHRLAEVLVLCQGGHSGGRSEDARVLHGAKHSSVLQSEDLA
jgi:hypothetical protein